VIRPASAFRADGSLNVVVETPRGALAKFKYEEASDAMILSRPLPLGIAYPYDWGFVPATNASDGDPIDAMVLWDGTGYPGIVVPARIIGVLQVEQRNLQSGDRERNDRLFVVPVKAPRLDDVKTIFDMPERVRDEVARFFVNVVAFEGKDLRVLGFDGPAEGERLVRAAMRQPLPRDDR
jgi:inorganic pyrophosphatase